MFQEYLSGSDHLLWPLLATLLFFLTFVAVLGYVIRSVVKGKSFEEIASLPLEDDAPRAGDGRR